MDGDHRYLSRAASNLLQNAVRYAKQTVELRVEMVEGKRWLHVDDDGEKIPVADRERLFEPFTRLDTSRDRQSGGSGIGLAIVKQIARWHGGAAQIAESKLVGTRVSLSW
ncbi:MAG: ATP-binding protein [Usitatibacteraceae bacterium]